MSTTSEMYGDILNTGTKLSCMDMRTLRVRYSRILHIAFYKTMKLKRRFMVDKLLEVEFGDRFMEYEAKCKTWRDAEQHAVNAWIASLEDEFHYPLTANTGDDT